MTERARGDHGAGLVAGIVVMFAGTFLGLVWLADTVDRNISNQTAATSIAFQAARSGAQAAQVDDLRIGVARHLDAAEARAAADTTAARLFERYDVDGTVTRIDVDQATSTVTVTVRITEGPRAVTGRGAAEAVEVT